MAAAAEYEMVPPKEPAPLSGAGDEDEQEEDEQDEDEQEEELSAEELAALAKQKAAEEEDVLGESLVSEILSALYEARFLAPVLALLGLLIGYQLTIAPYRVGDAEKTLSEIELWKIRPVLDEVQQRVIRVNTMNAETQFSLPLPSYDTIKLRFHSAVTQKGVHQPPELFYQGVVFGISDTNSHDLDYHRHHQRDLQYDNLYEDLTTMRPRPTAVMARSAQYNTTGWRDSGYAVYFSWKDLENQGKLSSDKLQPWKRVLEDVLVIARNHRQVCITAWYPHEFGRPTKEQDQFRDQSRKNDPDFDTHLYESVLQQVIPTRTGLTHLRSTVPVWMSAFNFTEPQKRQLVYRKDWTEDDHWSHYHKGGHKHYEVEPLIFPERVARVNGGSEL